MGEPEERRMSDLSDFSSVSSSVDIQVNISLLQIVSGFDL